MRGLGCETGTVGQAERWHTGAALWGTGCDIASLLASQQCHPIGMILFRILLFVCFCVFRGSENGEQKRMDSCFCGGCKRAAEAEPLRVVFLRMKCFFGGYDFTGGRTHGGCVVGDWM